MAGINVKDPILRKPLLRVQQCLQCSASKVREHRPPHTWFVLKVAPMAMAPASCMPHHASPRICMARGPT